MMREMREEAFYSLLLSFSSSYSTSTKPNQTRTKQTFTFAAFALNHNALNLVMVGIKKLTSLNHAHVGDDDCDEENDDGGDDGDDDDDNAPLLLLLLHHAYCLTSYQNFFTLLFPRRRTSRHP